VLVPDSQFTFFSAYLPQFTQAGFDLTIWSLQLAGSYFASEKEPCLTLCCWNPQMDAWISQIQSLLPTVPVVLVLDPENMPQIPANLVPSEIILMPFQIQETLMRLNLVIKRQQDLRKNLPDQFPEMFYKHSAVMLMINPETGEIVDANQAASHFYGYASELIKKMKISEINTLSPQEVKVLLDNALSNQRNSFEFEHRLANGEVRSVEVHSTPMILDGKKRLFSVISDISARKQAELALLKSEARYREIVEASEQGICLIDPAGLILFANPKMLKILEIEELQQIIGCSISSFILAEDLTVTEDKLEESSAKRLVIQDFKLQTSRGNQCWVSVSITPLYDENQWVTSSLMMVTDITERKIWEQTTQKTLHEREILLQEIHHRVKNNFQLIISLLRLQVRKTELPEVKVSLKKSQNRIRTMALIHEQLYLSKNIAQVYFDEYLKSLTRELHQSYRQESSACALRFRLESLQLGLQQAIPCSLLLHELISNAFKYAFTDHQNDAEVCICLYQQEEQIFLEVHDNGIGFDFDPDKPLNSLGLQLVKQLCEQINGTLACENNQGTHWKVSFLLESSQTLKLMR